ncbi:TetR/AcrR family transcriptional regulator [Noviherbaspirillum sp.]|uniref:TetR/AcrR family transcriptional regulator n=1 Tax=Noviherbaspirillum sp. TaxID=1926288 RepID=UPI002FE3D61D
MAAVAKHREKIVCSAALLFRRKGYAATGLNDIVDLSGAPKGSIYHYFPKGKEQIAVEAVQYAAGLVSQSLRKLAERHSQPAGMVQEYGTLLAGFIAKSNYEDGCPITSILLELSTASPQVAEAGRAAFAEWVGIYRTKLTDAGLEPERAYSLALLTVTSYQGALLLAKVQCSSDPILQVAGQLAELYRAAC